MPDRLETAPPGCRSRARGYVVTCVTAVLALALAGSAPARAEDAPWLLGVEGGLSAIHDDDRSAGGALRLSRDLGGGPLRFQLGVAAAAHGAMDLGLEWRVLRRARVSPFLGVGGGLMSEDEYFGPFLRATAGLEARLSDRAVLRLGAQAGTHDGQAGPHQATIGIGWRF
jgi:hypothetical protein